MVVKKEKEEEKHLDIFQNQLVSKHEPLNAEEKAELMKKLNITVKQLPRIKSGDPAIKMHGLRRGDIVRIIRNSLVAGEYYYYRVVA